VLSERVECKSTFSPGLHQMFSGHRGGDAGWVYRLTTESAGMQRCLQGFIAVVVGTDAGGKGASGSGSSRIFGF
jgi:hypothetical protein